MSDVELQEVHFVLEEQVEHIEGQSKQSEPLMYCPEGHDEEQKPLIRKKPVEQVVQLVYELQLAQFALQA